MDVVVMNEVRMRASNNKERNPKLSERMFPESYDMAATPLFDLAP